MYSTANINSSSVVLSEDVVEDLKITGTIVKMNVHAAEAQPGKRKPEDEEGTKKCPWNVHRLHEGRGRNLRQM